MNRMFTKEEMAHRIDFLVDCGFDRDVAVKIAMFQGSDGLVFAIPSKSDKWLLCYIIIIGVPLNSKM